MGILMDSNMFNELKELKKISDRIQIDEALALKNELEELLSIINLVINQDN